MITIRTSDLVGTLADVTPFAASDKDVPDLNVIRLEWDGRMLHAQSTDRFRIGWASWSPDDEPEIEVQDDLFTNIGSGDNPWHCYIPLADAEHLVKTFKLPTKEAVVVPLTVDYDAQRGRVKVARSRTTGHSAIDIAIDTQSVEYPNLRELLAVADLPDVIDGITFTAKLLADFAKVRARGPLQLRFTRTQLVHVTIGERFVGAIVAREKAEG